MKNQTVFFKYKTLDNFEFILDLILKERLYAAKYDELNDPMEGVVKIDGTVPRNKLAEWEDLVSKLRVCCFTKQSDNMLMWSHYADGGRGCRIEFELANGQRYHKVSYLKKPILSDKGLTKESAIEMLKFKDKPWNYESEYRCIVEDRFVPIKIKSILFGPRARKETMDLLIHVIQECRPDLKLSHFHGRGRELFRTIDMVVTHRRIYVPRSKDSTLECDKCLAREIAQRNFIYMR